jgi:hypothetical protein
MKLIPLTQEKFAMVDDDDFEELNKHKWQAHRSMGDKTYYAIRSEIINGKSVGFRMHRQIMGCVKGDGKIIDHKNGNGLDCQRHNMRFATTIQSATNRTSHKGATSKYLGVYLQRAGKYSYWRTDITVNKRKILIGSFKTEENAATAYNLFAEKHFGEFANLNH